MLVGVTLANSVPTSATQRLVVAKADSGYESTIVADGDSASPSIVRVANCFRPDTVTVVPGGGQRITAEQVTLCGASIQAFDPGALVTGSILTEFDAAGGMHFSFPVARHPLQSSADSFRVGGAVNTAHRAAFLLAFNEGSQGGEITLVSTGPDGRELGREWVQIPARSTCDSANVLCGGVHYAIQTAIPAGAITVQLGKVCGNLGTFGCGDPSLVPSGPVWGWLTFGPAAGNAAPRVVAIGG